MTIAVLQLRFQYKGEDYFRCGQGNFSVTVRAFPPSTSPWAPCSFSTTQTVEFQDEVAGPYKGWTQCLGAQADDRMS